MYSYDIKIPKERIAVLIGKKGTIKKRIEKKTDTVIDVDSREGIVTVTGDDGLRLLTAQQIIKAISRGFNPELAFQLEKPDYSFELIDLTMLARNKNDEARLKGRIIGEKGKSWKTIEELTETNLSVYGKTVAIIGEASNVVLCKRALSMLIEGSRHSTVYHWLEKQRTKMKIGQKVL
tara:strand:+ start:251 stop:784 length:534 start_codon:yes stop_codon:yes gene_type:complete